MKRWICCAVLFAAALPAHADGCAVWRDLGPGTRQLVNTCVDPWIRALLEVRSPPVYPPGFGAPRLQWAGPHSYRAHSVLPLRPRAGHWPGERPQKPILLQRVPGRPPTQAELEALVTSGPEPGRTWGIPILPRVGEDAAAGDFRSTSRDPPRSRRRPTVRSVETSAPRRSLRSEELTELRRSVRPGSDRR
jgi:hypothetical protein